MKRKTFDLKLGYSCNNKCFHCVVEPYKMMTPKNKMDYTYKEIIATIDSPDVKESNTIVLTGGEPTIRPDFLNILKYINKRYKDKGICLQTNGRKLSQYLDEIKNMGLKISYVIAVHGPEEIHNDITGIKNNEEVNPFKETMESIKKLISLYGDFKKVARAEIVLSQKNLNYLSETVEFLLKEGVDFIAISYPHLDGYELISPEEVRKRGFPYKWLRKELKKITEIAYKNPELIIEFEALPICAIRDEEGNIYDLPSNFRLTDYKINESVSVKYPGNKYVKDHISSWEKIHYKPEICYECAIESNCIGIWKETYTCIGIEGLEHIKREELFKIPTILNVNNVFSFKKGGKINDTCNNKCC
ncbi:MAG: radical SAM protein [Thermovenabulum sp.]|uniref:radical SAM protein n=1 Tax=Thermovenabulum sp. TaxID=3100335 RepID=UPI003C7D5466